MISVPERVKDALRDGRLLKTYRFNVLESDGTVDFTIDNDTLVYESVKIDERMCSGDTLKFGLCEGSSLEFQYFDHENITGRQLQCFIDVQYKDADGDLDEHTIPMGFFTVKKCSRQASTGIQKVTAYNKLQSEYLDQNSNQILIEARQSYDTRYVKYNAITLDAVLNQALADYEIIDYETDVQMGIPNYFSQTTNVQHWDLPIYDQNHNQTGNYLHALQTTISFGVMDENLLEYIDGSRPYWSLQGFWKVQINCENLKTIYLQYLQNYKDQLGLNNYLLKLDNEYVDFIEYFMSFVFYPMSQLTQYQYPQITIYTYEQSTPWRPDKGILNITSPVIAPICGAWSNSAGIDRKALGTITYIPSLFVVNTNMAYSGTDEERQETRINALNLIENIDFTLFKQYESGIGSIIVSDQDLSSYPNVTLRQLQAATFEVNCQFGQLDRVTDLFSGAELNHTALYPADTLYPANDLYPGGTSETSFRSWYSKLWTDTVGEQSFRNLIITYKGLDQNNTPADFTLEVVVDQNGTTDYIMDDNWLFRNLIWTQADIESYAAAMVTKMQSIKWFPFEMWAAGLPYIETGDMIEIIVGDETYTSYVLQRQLSGIQNLQDTYINGTLDIF